MDDDTNQLPGKITNPNGQPSKYSPELFEAICTEIETGKSVHKTCAMYDIPYSTFKSWVKLCEATLARYAQAQTQQADAMFEAMVDDTRELKDVEYWIELARKLKAEGIDVKVINAIISGRDKGLGRDLDIIKRISPEKYGDKLETHSTVTVRQFVVSYSPEPAEVIELEPVERLALPETTE